MIVKTLNWNYELEVLKNIFFEPKAISTNLSTPLKQSFYSPGKLLFTGEYIILKGAKGLALPTQKGQSLIVTTHKNATGYLSWKSLDETGNTWFSFHIPLSQFQNHSPKNETEKTLLKILREAQLLNPDFLSPKLGYEVNTQLEFSRNWGLGSSSTLIHNIATWAKVDPYTLLFATLGGSGYDVAVAEANSSIVYSMPKGKPTWEPVSFYPPFAENLFFVYLEKKQNTAAELANFMTNTDSFKEEAKQITEITECILCCETILEFKAFIIEHETILSKVLKTPTIKQQLFWDSPCVIKSLGAWGGDFILCVGNQNEMEYFRRKGLNTILTFDEMIKL